jgi:hypothetical protein
MKRNSMISLFTAAIMFAEQSGTNGGQVINKHIEAVGGKENWKKAVP